MTKRERQAAEYAEEARRDREFRRRVVDDVVTTTGLCPHRIVRVLGIVPPSGRIAKKMLENLLEDQN